MAGSVALDVPSIGLARSSTPVDERDHPLDRRSGPARSLRRSDRSGRRADVRRPFDAEILPRQGPVFDAPLPARRGSKRGCACSVRSRRARFLRNSDGSLRIMTRMPDGLLKLGGVSRIFADKARHLVRSSSGLCLVVAQDGDEPTDLLVGRALQRAWLALTEARLAAQPMMSLLVLENVADRGDRDLREALGPDKLEALRAEFRSLAPEIEGRRPAWLMRFGHAPPPSGRTGRLPIASVVLGTGRSGAPSPTTGTTGHGCSGRISPGFSVRSIRVPTKVPH